MNILLTDEQLIFIQTDLKQKGFTSSVTDELIDHICCAVEKEMSVGVAFEQAYSRVVANFGPDGLQVIQQQSSILTKPKHKSIRHLSLFTASIAASLLLFALVTNASNKTEINPILCSSSDTYKLQIQVECPISLSEKGTDFMVPAHTPVIATAAGIILSVKEDKGHYGKYIIVDHFGQYQTLYAHLSSDVVYKGQHIKKGEVIGYSAMSQAATKSYLHYEVISDKSLPENKWYRYDLLNFVSDIRYVAKCSE